MIDKDRLKRSRLAKGISQQAIANMLGVDRTTYCKYEAGQSDPNLARLNKLAEILDVTPNYLMGQENDPIPLEHQDIFDLYLKLSDEQKAAIDIMIKTMAAK